MSRVVPELRFPEFTGDWRTQKLSAVLKSKGKRNKDLRFGPEHVLSVSGELGVVNQIEHLGRSYAGASVAPYHVVETGDIVYTKSPLKANPFGIIKANRGAAGIVSTLYAVYEVRDGHDPVFWDRYFELDDRTNRYLKPLVNKGAKNDMKISNERVLIDPVVAPALDEQQRIAAFFDTAARKITLLTDKKTALEDYKRGLMQRLFSRELRFTRDDGSAFPDWEERKLGHLIEVFYGKDHKHLPDGDIPVLGSGGIMRHVDEALAHGPAIVIGRKGTIDRPWFVEGPFWTVDTLFYTKVRGKNVPRFVFAVMQTINWLRYNEATGVPSLSASAIKKVPVSVPKDPGEQRKIAAALSALDAKIDTLSQKISEMETFKKGLLQKLFV